MATTAKVGANELREPESPVLEEPVAGRDTDVFGARVTGYRADRIRSITMAGDVVALLVALGLAALLGAVLGHPGLDWTQLAIFTLLLPLWVVLGIHFNLYRVLERTTDWSFADDVSAAFVVCSIWGWFWLLAMSAIAVGVVLPSLALWAFSILLVPVGRSLVRTALKRAPWYRQSVLLVGGHSAVDRVRRRIARQPDWCFDVVRSVEIGPWSQRIGADAIVSMADAAGVERVIVAEGPTEISERTRLIRGLLELGISVDLVSSEADVFRSTAQVSNLEGLPTLSYSPVRLSSMAHAIKRTIDVSCASIMLIGLSPLLAYIALRVKLDSPGPVFFTQDRRGQAGSKFKLIKFRTMTADAEGRLSEVEDLKLHPGSATFKAARDPRVTRYGDALRRRSLDEIPQLWNIIMGDMSLVGPRPLPLDEAAHVPARYRAREQVRPGLTGPWQVLGRSDIPFEDMIKLDYMYVSTWSPRGDLKLMLRTVAVVFGARGAY